ncbi:PilN family type IVB pilus formation outer membrane protein [Chromobacterium violaceum]|uniref:PilN family type IVB pilus formation outer membrane protein n=1 Tax=Chromobacterium violaceum TaxID=536 RepID=UPI0005D2F67B|nr:PilN family type IVB pilus formation outer membrane protein [Chromobacterium violaceum]KJH67532.1 piln [Chromobacterium violaceum]
MVKFPKTVLVSCLIAGLSGCASSEMKHVGQTAQAEIEHSVQGLDTMRGAAGAQAVRVHEHGYWVSTKEHALPQADEMVSCQLTMAEADPLTLDQFASRIKHICGVPVLVSADAKAMGKGGSGPNAAFKGSAKDGNAEAGGAVKVHVNWHGALSGLLDSITLPLGLHWNVRDGAVHLFKHETRVFPIYALPGTDALSSSVASSGSSTLGSDGGGSGGSGGSSGSSSGGGSGSASNSSSLATSLKSSVMDDIRKTVASMLTPGEGKLELSMATASLAVTDAPEVLDRIKAYLDQQNKMLTTQVVLNVKILNVSFNRSDQYGVDWSLINTGANSTVSPMEGNGKGIGSDSIGANIQILKGPFSGSKLLLKALSDQGKVSVVTQPSVTTLNLQAVPMQVATQQSYVASVSSTSTANVGTSSSISPGSVTTGFNMLMLPYAMADKQVLLQYNINLSDLKALDEFKDDSGNAVQLPTVDLRAFSQKVRLRSGETLVLSGFEQQSNNNKKNGVGSPDNQWLGGMRSANQKHEAVVIMITPVVMG